jgi:protein-tyrosine phosphatase
MSMDFSEITENLFIGTTPRTEAYQLLRRLGVGLVINMRVERRPHPDYHNPPLPVLWLPTFDSPLVPIPLSYLRRGARRALETLKTGGKVYVHCAGGRHRGVAMGAAILIAQGYSPEEAMLLIKKKRQNADPDAWYIKRQILRFASQWNNHRGQAAQAS